MKCTSQTAILNAAATDHIPHAGCYSSSIPDRVDDICERRNKRAWTSKQIKTSTYRKQLLQAYRFSSNFKPPSVVPY